MSGLREIVARGLYDHLCSDDGLLRYVSEWHDGETITVDGDIDTDAIAEAIIPVILAEAAKVAREKGETCEGDPWDAGWDAACEDIAAAIEGMG